MAERLADGNVAIALLGNTIPTGAILVVLITIFGPISGAHFNPAVTLSFALRREITKRDSLLYVTAQVFGGIAGVLAAHLMFEHPLLDPSTTSRSGIGQWTGEFVATFGLVGTILACIKARPLCGADGCWALYHSSLLVHVLHIVRKPCGHDCARLLEHFCRDRPC